MAKKKNMYFNYFEDLINYSCSAAEFLQKCLKDFNPETLDYQMVEMHSIEHEADNKKHEMMSKLAKEFVTPIEREDIMEIAAELDEVTDLIEDVLMRIHMYDIKEITPEALLFADVIVRSCYALRCAIEEFHNFAKSDKLQQNIIDVNTLEEEGDKLYFDAVHDLFRCGKDAVQILAWSETYDRLEMCCDTCEHVANSLESVMMKNR